MSEPTSDFQFEERRDGEYRRDDVLLDRYHVKGVLGRGGMGVVYLVKDAERDEHIALKTIVPKYTNNRRAIVRFMREARAVRKLNHPAIVEFYDAGKMEDNLYFTMEFARGQSVHKMLRDRKRFGIGSTVRILYLLCDALQTAHEISVHRDLSPGNLMVTPDSMLKLLDFGLAKLLLPPEGVTSSAYKPITQKGVLLGKRWYIAPEQRADAASVDGRADLYSVGVMFHEMLTGHIPVAYEPITKHRPDLPEICDEFLQKTLAESPEDRYANAAEAGEALLRIHKERKAAKTR